MGKFLTRGFLGMVLIYGINQYLEYKGISIGVGMNFLSFLTSGSLGFPGVALLYGIVAVNFL